MFLVQSTGFSLKSSLKAELKTKMPARSADLGGRAYLRRDITKSASAKLIDACIASRDDLAESHVRNISDGTLPLCVVPGIEGLESELQAQLLREPEILKEPCIPVVKTRQIQIPRPELPRKPAAGCLNACVLNHLAIVGVMLAFASPTRSARSFQVSLTSHSSSYIDIWNLPSLSSI
jgi:hypothetical protein